MTEKKKSGFEALATKTSLYPEEKLMKVKKGKHSFFIGLPKEVSLQENRISLTPDAVALLVNGGPLAALATALAPQIGYAAAAELSKRSVRENVLIRELVKREGVLPADQIDDVLDLRKMTEIGVPGGKHGAVAAG